MSFFGGGTDMEEYFKENEGAVLSTTFDKYCYINVRHLPKEKHLENLIQFLGYRSDIQNTMKQFDFVVLSSLWEGLPLTPIEAFSVGKTVIGTSVDGTPEIIEDKENGLLVNAKDVRQLSDAMNILIEDENLRKELEVNAKKCYMEEFSFDKLAKEYRDYYGRL